MFHTYVASKCFILKEFHRGTVSDGARPRRREMGRDNGEQRAGGRLSSPAHAEREEGVRGNEWGAVTRQGARARRTGVGCAAVHPDARSGGRKSPTVPTGGHVKSRHGWRAQSAGALHGNESARPTVLSESDESISDQTSGHQQI
jgi:hypothetical protein